MTCKVIWTKLFKNVSWIILYLVYIFMAMYSFDWLPWQPLVCIWHAFSWFQCASDRSCSYLQISELRKYTYLTLMAQRLWACLIFVWQVFTFLTLSIHHSCPKIWCKSLLLPIMCLETTECMANSVDPDQMWVFTACSDLSDDTNQ